MLKSISPPPFLAALGAGCLSVVLLAGHPSRAETPDPIVAKVNGAEIHDSDVTLAEQQLGPGVAQMDPASRHQNVVEFLIDLKLAARAADSLKLRDTDAFKRQAAFAIDRLSMDTLLARQSGAVTDDNLKKAYADAVQPIKGKQQAHILHILVESEDAAKQAIAEIKKGADFADVAKKESKDAGAENGGDLGFVIPEQLEADFAKAAFALEIGKLSDPVKTQFGWHVIKVVEKRDLQAPSFDQLKPQLTAVVIRKAQAEYVSKLHDGAKIERFDLAAAQSTATPDAKAVSAKPDKK